MGSYRQTLSIAGIRIAVESEKEFRFSDRCVPFAVEEEGTPDAVFQLQEAEDPDLTGWDTLWNERNHRIFLKDGKQLKVCYEDQTQKQISWYLRSKGGTPYTYEVMITSEEIFTRINPLFMVEVSEFLIRYDAMILHSSFIDYKGHGIVFSAPSGTGKSTQAELWKNYYGAEILNGDRSILRKTEGEYRAYGSPYAGSSQIHVNRFAPLTAIVVLRQAGENKIRRMGLKEAYLCLLSEMSISPISRNIIDEQSDWLLELLKEVPVFLLSCLPDQGAADTLYEELKENFHENE